MDLGAGILAATSVFGVVITLCVAILSWRDKRVKEIRSKIAIVIRRERRIRYRETQCRNALYSLYAWVYWAERNLILGPGATPPPKIPEHPQFIDIEDGEDDDGREDGEDGNEHY